MTEPTFSSIDEAAAWWWLQSRQAMPVEQQQALQTWLAADPRHATAFAAMQQTALSLEQLRQPQPLPAMTRRARPHRRPARPLLALACSLLLCVLLFWQYGPQQASYQQSLQAGNSLQTLALPDGSSVLLDQASAADIRLYDDRREVVLHRGQALFEVSKDSKRPFIVSAGDTSITVLGTRFSVRHDAGDIRVEVASGLVRVSNAEHTRLLTAGEGMRISEDNWLPTRQLATDSVASWQHRQLVFDNTPLPEALAEFARYGAAPVSLSDTRLQGLRITGSFRHDQPQQFLALLPEVLPVRVQQQQGQWRLSPR